MAINLNLQSISLNGGRLSERVRTHYLRIQHAFRQSLVVLSVRGLTDVTLTSNLFGNRSIYDFLQEFPRVATHSFHCNTSRPLTFSTILTSLPQLTQIDFRNHAVGTIRRQFMVPLTEELIPPPQEMQLYIRNLTLDMMLFIRSRLPFLEELTLIGTSTPRQL